MQKLKLWGLLDEYAPDIYTIGCDTASGPDQTVFIENNADFDVKKMREMLNKCQSKETDLKAFVEHISGQPLTIWQEKLLANTLEHERKMSKALFDQLYSQVWNPDYYPTGLTVLPQAGSQIAWREFIETKRSVDDGLSWLFRKSLVSMAITQVLKS